MGKDGLVVATPAFQFHLARGSVALRTMIPKLESSAREGGRGGGGVPSELCRKIASMYSK